MSAISIPQPPTASVAIVDDDPAVLHALACLFEIERFDVWTFSSAEDVLATPDLPFIDCWILDVRLGGMDGLELLGRLRERRPPVPAILITTPTRALIERARAAEVTLVEKPLINDRLMQEVRALV